MAKTTNITKTAADAAATKYWSELLGPEYGKLLTRDIPKRVKAAMLKRDAALAKTASTAEGELSIAPLSFGVSGDILTVEGIARTASGARRLFVADFQQSDGAFRSLQTLDLA